VCLFDVRKRGRRLRPRFGGDGEGLKGQVHAADD
jgi:hypothetical protein